MIKLTLIYNINVIIEIFFNECEIYSINIWNRDYHVSKNCNMKMNFIFLFSYNLIIYIYMYDVLNPNNLINFCSNFKLLLTIKITKF